jgi:quinol monooxygenase YgiN
MPDMTVSAPPGATEGAVLVVVRARIRTGQAGRLLAEVPRFVAQARAEPGCLEYDLYVSATEFEEITTVERWASAAAAAAHLAAPHTRCFLAAIAPCLATTPLLRQVALA